MIFNPFKSVRCAVCAKAFEKTEQIDRTDEVLVTRALMEGKFECVQCACVFHGKCGKIGQVSASKASVKCPRCQLMQKLPLPFTYKDERGKKRNANDEFLDKIRDQDHKKDE